METRESYDVFIQTDTRKDLSDESTLRYRVQLTPSQYKGFEIGFACLLGMHFKYLILPTYDLRNLTADDLNRLQMEPELVTRYPTNNGINIDRRETIDQLGKYSRLGRHAISPKFPYYARLTIPNIESEDLLIPLDNMEQLQGILTSWEWLGLSTKDVIQRVEDSSGNLLIVSY